jgi:hypothetical protein
MASHHIGGKMHKLAIVLCAVLLPFSVSVATASGTVTHTRTLNIAGTGNDLHSPDPKVNAVTGACNLTPWLDQCSVSNNCRCTEIAVSKASGSMDKGTQAITNFFVTTDKGDSVDPVDGNAPLVGGLEGRCGPIHGVLTDTSAAETKTVNIFGTSCRVINAISSANPSGNKVGNMFNGAWAIDGASPPSPPASGWGSFSGSSTNSSGAVSVKISGLVTE